ncbi:Protein of unknown function, partial [Gryllus bimaculatus]
MQRDSIHEPLLFVPEHGLPSGCRVSRCGVPQGWMLLAAGGHAWMAALLQHMEEESGRRRDLEARVARLEAAREQQEEEEAARRCGLAQLEARVGAVEDGVARALTAMTSTVDEMLVRYQPPRAATAVPSSPVTGKGADNATISSAHAFTTASATEELAAAPSAPSPARATLHEAAAAG